MDAEKKKKLMIQASEIREKTVELIYHGGGGHIGGDLSETDVMVVLFDKMKHDPKNSKWEGRDYFILSKGHSAETYYSLLNRYGYIGQKEMDEFGSFGALLGGHPNKKVNGVEANTGSLGHGLGFATGIAIALKKNEKNNHVYVITGDGELAEGSNWEALMSAAKYKLDNLTAIVDFNGLQISGKVTDVMDFTPIGDKFREFGWAVREIDGNNMDEIVEAFDALPFEEGKPSMIVAHTVKAKGLKEGEGKASYHYWNPSKEDCDALEKDLMEQLRGYEDEI